MRLSFLMWARVASGASYHFLYGGGLSGHAIISPISQVLIFERTFVVRYIFYCNFWGNWKKATLNVVHEMKTRVSNIWSDDDIISRDRANGPYEDQFHEHSINREKRASERERKIHISMMWFPTPHSNKCDFSSILPFVPKESRESQFDTLKQFFSGPHGQH